MKIVITGANSTVGRNLLAHIAAEPEIEAVAAVRSPGAAAALGQSENLRTEVIDYRDLPALVELMRDAACVVHLAGILLKSRSASYEAANFQSTAAVAAAAEQAGARHMVFVSVLGADPASANEYYRSKGSAEKRLAASSVPATILRTPLLLGPDTAGGEALLKSVRRGRARLLGGGGYRTCPLDVDDLSRAILRLCPNPPASPVTHELAGPETLSYRQLIERAAGRLGKTVDSGTMPLSLAKLGAAVSSRLRGGGFTPAVIDVITRDEAVTGNADRAIGITLTPLDETLDKIVRQQTDATDP